MDRIQSPSPEATAPCAASPWRIALRAGALVAALTACGFFSVVWFLTHSD